MSLKSRRLLTRLRNRVYVLTYPLVITALLTLALVDCVLLVLALVVIARGFPEWLGRMGWFTVLIAPL